MKRQIKQALVLGLALVAWRAGAIRADDQQKAVAEALFGHASANLITVQSKLDEEKKKQLDAAKKKAIAQALMGHKPQRPKVHGPAQDAASGITLKSPEGGKVEPAPADTVLKNDAPKVVIGLSFITPALPRAVVAPAAKPKVAEAGPKKDEAQAEKKKKAVPLAQIIAVAAPAAVPLNAAGGANANDAMVQQFIMQFQPLANVELEFVRQICPDLMPEQRIKVKSAVEASVKDAAGQQARFQMPGVQRAGAARIAPQPAKIIRTSLAEILRETLTTEQMARYEDESVKRSASRKHAATVGAISRMDVILFLTSEQRDQLTKSITDNWQDDWESWLMLSMYGNQYMPQIPDKLVVPHLTTDQASVWRGLQKINFASWNVFNANQVNDEGDDWWGNKPAPARPAAPNRLQQFLNAFNGLKK